ncbi:MAG: response regulator [Desulfobacterales bacterium]|jgi:CheY-like chemotaxis protein
MKATILVIEDNELNMILIRDLLELEGYRVIEAYDAERGLQIAREKKPDVILMDIQLPGMDGLTATRLIQKDPVLREIPIVALTAYAMEKDKKEAIAAGCIGFIAKPIDTRSFVNTVSKFILEHTH